MRKTMTLFFCLCSLLSATHELKAQTLAFPGAEGFGRYAKGARAASSPEVYHVVNLDDAGEGSFRDAISKPDRFIVFNVAGVINIKSRLVFSKNLTIAGQTAPGDGVVIYGNGVSFSGIEDVIVRCMRFRMGLNGDKGKDAAGIANGKNMIFDHLSVTWGRDENFSISWNKKADEPQSITIQNSILGQGIMVHSAGGLIQTSGGVTLYRNLYIDNKTRNPKVKGLNQYVNNVVYNWGNGGGYILGGGSQGPSWATIENNYFIKGPNTNNTAAFVRGNQNFQVLHSGNKIDENINGTLDGIPVTDKDLGDVFFVRKASAFKDIPRQHPPVKNKQSAENSYKWIVKYAGASFPARDAVDQLLIEELKSLGTAGKLIYDEKELNLPNNVGVVRSGVKDLDSDNDGIPDSWEDANGLDKNNPADALYMNGEYYNIEHYMNSLISTD